MRTMTALTVAKIRGGVVFVVGLGVQAAQSWSEATLVLPPAVRFGLFIAAAMLGGAQLLLPRPGEASLRYPAPEPRDPRSQLL